jgi:hypothetical protein
MRRTHCSANRGVLTSITAGTLLHRSKLALTVWFSAARLIATHRKVVSVGLDLLRKSGEFPMSTEELDDAAATVYEGI